jgi:hypothetical protein
MQAKNPINIMTFKEFITIILIYFLSLNPNANIQLFIYFKKKRENYILTHISKIPVFLHRLKNRKIWNIKHWKDEKSCD